MTKIDIQLNGNILTLHRDRARETRDDTEQLDIRTIDEATRYKLKSTVKRNSEKNKILFTEKLPDNNKKLLVYSDGEFIYCRFTNPALKNDFYDLVDVKIRTLAVQFIGNRLFILFFGIIINKYKLDLKDVSIKIDEHNAKRVNLPTKKWQPSKLSIVTTSLRLVSFSKRKLIQGSPPILSPINVEFKAGDLYDAKYHIFKPKRSYERRNPLFYYIPMTVTFLRGGKVMHVRRFSRGGLTLVRRSLLDIERTAQFRFFESYVVSLLLYAISHVVRKRSSKVVNIYFEKEAMKAEEGTFELFAKARDTSSDSKNFYIIRSDGEGFDRIKDEKNVLKNFTFKSYWYIYRANSVISTEAPSHVNVLRSNNRFLRRSLYNKKFVFLQHGVTYMKCQGPNSAFIVGREAEPTYMVVGSKKERDVVADMLKLPEERMIISGLPIYDKVEYGNINENSPDIATVMLTWKPYEEHFSDFSMTTYYKNTVMIYQELAKKMSPENIRIVAHPKVKDALMKTELKDSLWTEAISEALHGTKLLVTDYSSVCYNSFYQGAGVIFFQPDVEEYEADNGLLIPADEEYIGPRTRTETEFLKVLNQVIDKKGSILLGDLRKKKYVDNHNSINEFHDGKNIDRIYTALKRHKLV